LRLSFLPLPVCPDAFGRIVLALALHLAPLPCREAAAGNHAPVFKGSEDSGNVLSFVFEGNRYLFGVYAFNGTPALVLRCEVQGGQPDGYNIAALCAASLCDYRKLRVIGHSVVNAVPGHPNTAGSVCSLHLAPL